MFKKFIKSKTAVALVSFAIGGLFGGGVMAQIKDKVMPTGGTQNV